MPTYTLRPNADGGTSGGTFTLVGGATPQAVLSDSSNTTGIQSAGSAERIQFLGMANATGTIPAGEVIISVTPYVVAFDSRSGLNTSSVFDFKVGINNGFNGNSEGATFVSQVPATSYVTCKGPTSLYPPGQPNVDWSFAIVDGLQAYIRSQIATVYYETYFVVETVVSGTPTATAPTGTIANRKPTVTWTYSLGAAYQQGAQVKVFSSAQYSAGGFAPATSTATASTTFAGSSQSWNVPTALADGAYRAYVWVQQTGGSTYYGPSFVSFTVSDAVTTPTLDTPADLSTMVTSTPTLTASMTAQAGGATKQLQFQVASDSGFTNNLQTISTGTLIASGSQSVTIPVLSRLAQGVWYWRARAIDQFSTAGSYATARSFTVAHQPAASSLTPSLGLALAYSTSVALAWSFTDPSTSDSQTAYQVQVGKGSSSTPTIDTGIVVSTATTYTATVDVTYKDQDLWWRVRVRDTDSVWSEWSATSIFYLYDLPVAAITAPTGGGVVSTPSPTITWTFTASAGRTQAQYRARILNLSAGSAVVATSDWVTGTALSWTPPLPVVDLATNYQAVVEVKDSAGLTSTAATANFTASYSLPSNITFTVDTSLYSSSGRVRVAWPTATPDANFVAWRVYRRPASSTTWTLIKEITTSGTLLWDDYTVPANTAVQYAVVHAAVRFSLTVESIYSASASFTGINEFYSIVCPDNPSLNILLYSVHADSFSDEKEMTVLNVIGRGRVAQYGTKYGKSGSLDVAFYDNEVSTARAQRLALEAARDSGLKLYLRNPFGDVWTVALVDLQIERIPGVGNLEFTKATIGYSEIS